MGQVGGYRKEGGMVEGRGMNDSWTWTTEGIDCG